MKAPVPVDEVAGLRVPPHSIEAEQSVLGCLLLDNSAWDRAGDLLRAENFYDRRHGTIYSAISSLVTVSRPADVVTVFEHLQRLGKAEECGELTYLNALAASVPSAANLRRYAEIVRERADERDLITAADTALTIAQGAGTFEDRLDRIDSLFDGIARKTSKQRPRHLSEVITERIDRISELHEGKAQPGWPTGIPWLDRALNGGLNPGRVYGLAARPSVGKSSLGAWIGLEMARNGHPTLMLSQEMPAGEVADRVLSSVGRLDYGRLQTGAFGDEDWGRLAEAAESGSLLPFYVDDQPSLRLMDIRAKARAVKGLKVLIVDYLQLCAGSGTRDNRNGEIEEITRGLKALAKEMGVAVLVLSQLNRDVEKRANKRPNLGDLRDSGAIEQDLDVVMFLWPVREFPGEGRRILGLGVDKNRQGQRGEIGLDFYGATQRWGQSTADIRPSVSPSGGFE